jgi:anti-sigma factor RsiW
MNHDDAKKSNAAEAYILDDLKPNERDAFEEHFFDCTECAADVRDAAKVAGGLRTSDARVKVPAVGRFNWWAAAASVFAALLGYQSLVVVPHIQTAMHTQTQTVPVMRLATETTVLEPQSRGTGEPVKVRRDEAVPFTIAIPTKEPYATYICEIRDAANHVRASLSVPAREANDPIPLVVAPGVLSSGNYQLVIRGGDREIAAYPFTVEVR